MRITSQSIVIGLLLSALFGCSGQSGPSNTEAEDAIKRSLESQVPPQLGYGNEASVEEIKIIEIGVVQGEGTTQQYWPVKVYASGTRMIGTLTSKAKRKSFKGEVVYKLSIDGFGVWRANPD